MFFPAAAVFPVFAEYSFLAQASVPKQDWLRQRLNPRRDDRIERVRQSASSALLHCGHGTEKLRLSRNLAIPPDPTSATRNAVAKPHVPDA